MVQMDTYDERVSEFLKDKGVRRPFFVIAIDEDGVPFAFSDPLREFRKLEDNVPIPCPIINFNDAWWWVYEGSRRARSKIGGSQYDGG